MIIWILLKNPDEGKVDKENCRTFVFDRLKYLALFHYIYRTTNEGINERMNEQKLMFNNTLKTYAQTNTLNPPTIVCGIPIPLSMLYYTFGANVEKITNFLKDCLGERENKPPLTTQNWAKWK